ncbi:MAG: adenylate kinase [Chloroflexi bacterium]|nr:adenylate kinase [Chloroflexota bacterium]
MAVYVVLLGPPGAGKGTQAEILSEKLGLAHVSSGDLFRENIKNQTELGKLAKGFMDRGDLVPDDVTIAMVRERLSRPDCAKGALLDGYPRTPAQAAALSQMLNNLGGKVDVVPYIRVDEEELVRRLSGRWTCRAEGHIYHEVFNPPKQTGVCDVDGSELYQREDDKRETVQRRIHVYLDQTAPLIDYYRKEGSLVEVDGAQNIEAVTQDLLAAMPAVAGGAKA